MSQQSNDQPDEKSSEAIADEALRVMEKVINNNVQTKSCPIAEQKAIWKRGEIKKTIAEKLQPTTTAGPKQIK